MRASIPVKVLQQERICGGDKVICGHPRQAGIFNFGGGEIAVLHYHAPCAYERVEEAYHDYGGYHSRAVVLLQRSYDGGRTWRGADNQVVFDETEDLQKRRGFLFQPGAGRARIDLGAPESAVHFGRSYAGAEDAAGRPACICFALRSADKGRSWEQVPTIIKPPPGWKYVHKDNHPLVRMPDGSLLGAFTVQKPDFPGAHGILALYGSDNDGLSFSCLAEIARDPTGIGRPTYGGLILLPGGRLQCYMLNINGLRNAICMCHSDDGGYSFSPPRPIVCWGQSPWRQHAADAAETDIAHSSEGGAFSSYFYRSPWPLLLSDGRILVLFARRMPPYGIGGLVSEDDGETWSVEFILRHDAAGDDIGYPVATEVAAGEILAAYYYLVPWNNRLGWLRTIEISRFRI